MAADLGGRVGLEPRETSVLISNIRNFIDDESGAYTVWSLIWFSLYLAIGGLAVDMTDAYRIKSQLQATADASALAAVISLPDQSDARSKAVNYSRDNMLQNIHGTTVRSSEVVFGTWNIATRTFTLGASNSGDLLIPDAVMVTARRASNNENPLATNFLRIIGLMDWDINATAIAIKYLPLCANDGFIAHNRVFYRANNEFYNNICIHGQYGGVALRGPNNYHEPGVRVSMSDLDLLDAPGPAYNTVADALAEGDAFPYDSYKVNSIIDGLTDIGPNGGVPGFMFVDSGGAPVTPEVVTVSGNYSGPFEQNKIYDISCNGQINLGQGVVLERTMIVADCRIHAAASMTAGNVVLASRHVGGSAAVHLAAKSGLGLADNCAAGGGVEVYTPGDVHVSAQGEWHGLRIVAGNDVKFTANNSGVHGISVQAGNDIDFTSNNEFGLCAGNNPGEPSYRHRLVY